MIRYLVPGLFLFGTVVLAFLYLRDPGPRPLTAQDPSGPSIKFDKLEQYKKETAIKIGLDKQRASLDKIKNRAILDPEARKKSQFHKSEFADSTDPRSEVLDDGSVYGALTLDQRMDQFLAKKESYEVLEEAQKQAYVREFIREARLMGFEVKINDQMEITEVSEIDNP